MTCVSGLRRVARQGSNKRETNACEPAVSPFPPLTRPLQVASIVLRDVARKGQGSKGSVPGVLEPAAAVKQAVALMAVRAQGVPVMRRCVPRGTACVSK